MRYYLSIFFVFFVLFSCKRDRVDASSLKEFQASINEMATELNTLKQVKFNEALYILKTFGVEGGTDVQKIKNLSKLLEGKTASEIFVLADQVAQKNEVEWASSAPPSLGGMNIFGSIDSSIAQEQDPTDIGAYTMQLNVLEEPGRLSVVPRLLDKNQELLDFSNATLEVILEVNSGGVRIYSLKNLMQDNHFKGFKLQYANLPSDKVVDEKIDISVTIVTKKKRFKRSKLNIETGIVPKPKAEKKDSLEVSTRAERGDSSENSSPETTEKPEIAPSPEASKKDPKAVVYKFLNHLNSGNLKGAFDSAENPSWGSFERFSDPVSGFGSVKNVSVKNVSLAQVKGDNASINAQYEVKDKDGKTIALNVSFGLKISGGDWKIVSYKIN